MAAVQGLTHLRIGQRVKVKGNPGTNGEFKAMEIKVKPGEDEAVMEGKIQAVDPEKRTIKVINREIHLGEHVELKDVLRQPIGFEALKVGDIIKLKGTYSDTEGFKPLKAKLQLFKGYDIQELQGTISDIDADANTMKVVGYRVVIEPSTEIEGI